MLGFLPQLCCYLIKVQPQVNGKVLPRPLALIGPCFTQTCNSLLIFWVLASNVAVCTVFGNQECWRGVYSPAVQALPSRSPIKRVSSDPIKTQELTLRSKTLQGLWSICAYPWAYFFPCSVQYSPG